MDAHTHTGTTPSRPPKRFLSVVDCTLREGDQTPGVWLTTPEKLILVDLLAAAGVRYLDAGMPEVEAEREFFRQATGRTTARIGASIRLRQEAVQLAVDSGCDALFIICPTSPIHRETRLGLTLEALLQQVDRVVSLAAGTGREINLVAEDSPRTPPDELLDVLDAALQAGAHRLFLCDTVGVMTPSRMAALVRQVRDGLGPEVPLGVHCHNDFGMATANTVAAIEAGVEWPTVCINGVGERSGNASLAEVVLAAERLLGWNTGIDPAALPRLALEVERLTGLTIPPHQPVVGLNAYRHESGIHVDGLLKGAQTYEPIPPALVGRSRELVVGKHTGRAHLRYVAARHRLTVDDDSIDRALEMLRQRGPGDARGRFQTARAALAAWEREYLGVPEVEVLAMLHAVAKGME